jgi:AraC-like DNA-binding protein
MNQANNIRFKGFYYHHTVEEKPSPDEFSRHCHNMYEIIYIKKGNGTFYVEGSQYNVYPGCLLVFRPREFHCINVSPNSPYERLVVHFDESTVYENSALLLDIFHNREFGINNIYPDIKQSIPSTFERISSCSELNEPERSIMAKLILNELLVVLHNEFAVNPGHDSGEKLITRIVNYINENISSQFRLEELAEMFFISKYHLGHVFKKHTGMPVMEYIIRKRVVMAQQLISEGCAASIAATMSGFNDYSAFYRAYKGEFEVSPKKDF